MARPSKKRRVCGEPAGGSLIPSELVRRTKREVVPMTVDEYETIRLIDLEGLSQEECAVRMDIARTTAQTIYNSARTKLAECLVNRKELRITGGNYFVCDGAEGCSGCRKESSGDEPAGEALIAPRRTGEENPGEIKERDVL